MPDARGRLRLCRRSAFAQLIGDNFHSDRCLQPDRLHRPKRYSWQSQYPQLRLPPTAGVGMRPESTEVEGPVPGVEHRPLAEALDRSDRRPVVQEELEIGYRSS